MPNRPRCGLSALAIATPALLVSGAAFAQDADTFAVSGSAMDNGGTLQRHAPGLAEQSTGYAGLALTWAKDPLVFLDAETGEETVVVGSQVGTRLHGGYNFGGVARVDVELPLYPSVVVEGESQFSMGDLRLGALVPLTGVPGDRLVVGLSPFLTVPTGDETAYVTNGSVGGGLVASAGGRSGKIDWVADVGVDLSKPATIGLTTTGSSLDVGVGGSIPISESFRAGLELDQRISLAESEASAGAPSEVHAYGTWGECSGLFATLGAGTAIVSGVGSPDVRLIGMLSWRGAQCGPFDTDADGIFDDVDQCIEQPEDKDGFEDDDGCPEDNDGDGVPDAEDECPEIAGQPENGGCPDADGDGVLDMDDRCVNLAGPPELGGCPDTDGDGFTDPNDRCVDEPGGEGSTDGCPAIVITKEAVVITERVLFATNEARILSESFPLLNGVATVLIDNPQILRIEVQGHTDAVGKSGYNMELSQRRAEAVRRYLVDKGVETGRLTPVGYGETQPLVDEVDEDTRARNRRVEFKILDQ